MCIVDHDRHGYDTTRLYDIIGRVRARSLAVLWKDADGIEKEHRNCTRACGLKQGPLFVGGRMSSPHGRRSQLSRCYLTWW